MVGEDGGAGGALLEAVTGDPQFEQLGAPSGMLAPHTEQTMSDSPAINLLAITTLGIRPPLAELPGTRQAYSESPHVV